VVLGVNPFPPNFSNCSQFRRIAVHRQVRSVKTMSWGREREQSQSPDSTAASVGAYVTVLYCTQLLGTPSSAMVQKRPLTL
jgi:hypothetical protein